MIYNLADDLCRKQIEARLHALLDKRCVVELTEKTVRTGNQNRYLHAILGVVAMDTGNTLDFTKEQYFKRLVNPSLFAVERDDRIAGKVTVLRSTRDLTKEEMSTAIDRFRNWASEQGMYLPSPDDETLIASVEYQMGRMREYL